MATTTKPNGDTRAAVQELTTEVAVLTERLHAHKEAANKALNLQAKEYERRLDELNHVLAREREKDKSYMPREIIEKWMEHIDIWRREVDVDRATNASRNSTYTSVLAVLLAIVSIAVSGWHFLYHS